MARLRHSKQETRLREYLRDARKAKGVTQTALAQKLNVPQSFVSKYEQGERYLTFVEVLDLCALLEVDAMDLVVALQAAKAEEVRACNP